MFVCGVWGIITIGLITMENKDILGSPILHASKNE